MTERLPNIAVVAKTEKEFLGIKSTSATQIKGLLIAIFIFIFFFRWKVEDTIVPHEYLLKGNLGLIKSKHEISHWGERKAPSIVWWSSSVAKMGLDIQTDGKGL